MLSVTFEIHHYQLNSSSILVLYNLGTLTLSSANVIWELALLFWLSLVIELGCNIEMTMHVLNPFPHPYRNTHSQHHEHPKLATIIISCQWEPMCRIAIGGKTKIVSRWVYIIEIMVYIILLWNYRNIQSLTRKFWKNNFCASFPLYFLCAFLVSESLVSKYEQLLILTDIAISTLCVAYLKVNHGRWRPMWVLARKRFSRALLEWPVPWEVSWTLWEPGSGEPPAGTGVYVNAQNNIWTSRLRMTQWDVTIALARSRQWVSNNA